MPRVEWTTPARDEWLYASEAADLAGVSRATWRRSTIDAPTRKATAPKHERRDDRNGRPQWRRSTVLAYVKQRDAKRTGQWRPGATQLAEDRQVHAILERSAATLGTRATLANHNRTGISYRTTRRHLTGECACDLPAESA